MLRPRPVAYFSAEFGLHESIPIYSGGLGVLAGDHIKSASDLGHSAGRRRLVLRPGIFPPAPRSAGMAAGRIPPDRRQPASDGSRRSAPNGEPVTVQIETRGGLHSREGVADEGGPLRSAAARFQRGRQRSRRSRADVAAVWRRWPHSHPPGTAAGRRRFPCAAGHGHYARRASHERRAQRIRRAGSDPRPHAGRRHRLSTQACPRVAREVVFTTHTPVPAGHDRFQRRSDRRASRARCAKNSGISHDA